MFNNPFGLVSKSGSLFSTSTHLNCNHLLFKSKLIKILSVIIIFVFLTACEAKTPTITSPTPESGKGNVAGVIQSAEGKPYPGYLIRLAEVHMQGEKGAYVLDESFSPGAISDDKGAFLVMNAPEGEYVFIIGQPMQSYQPVTDAKGVLKRLTVKAGETLDLGTIKFDYQP